MDKKIDKIVREYVETVAAKNQDFVTAYLFGSYAKGTQREESDIDVAIIFDPLRDEDKFDLRVNLMLLSSTFDTRIEPHPLSSEDFYSDNPFAAEIKKTGIEMGPRTSDLKQGIE